jgi:hypothetical protein
LHDVESFGYAQLSIELGQFLTDAKALDEIKHLVQWF